MTNYSLFLLQKQFPEGLLALEYFPIKTKITVKLFQTTDFSKQVETEIIQNGYNEESLDSKLMMLLNESKTLDINLNLVIANYGNPILESVILLEAKLAELRQNDDDIVHLVFLQNLNSC